MYPRRSWSWYDQHEELIRRTAPDSITTEHVIENEDWRELLWLFMNFVTWNPSAQWRKEYNPLYQLFEFSQSPPQSEGQIAEAVKALIRVQHMRGDAVVDAAEAFVFGEWINEEDFRERLGTLCINEPDAAQAGFRQLVYLLAERSGVIEAFKDRLVALNLGSDFVALPTVLVGTPKWCEGEGETKTVAAAIAISAGGEWFTFDNVFGHEELRPLFSAWVQQTYSSEDIQSLVEYADSLPEDDAGLKDIVEGYVTQESLLTAFYEACTVVSPGRCSICQYALVTPYHKLRCEHPFHGDCIQAWLNTSKLDGAGAEIPGSKQDTCPHCRGTVY